MSRQAHTYPQLKFPAVAIQCRKLAHRRQPSRQFTFFEFFAGGGMARAGLGSGWTCLLANDFDFKKGAVYVENWGDDVLVTKDVGKIKTTELPGTPDLVWASFPCQDLSLAGMGAGLRGDRSGTFWPFWGLFKSLVAEGRAPKVVVLENVCGTLTSHAGQDFAAIANALVGASYRFGAVIIDAEMFLPHSRPRLFIVAVASGAAVPDELTTEVPSSLWHPRALRSAYARLDSKAQRNWIWWCPPTPAPRGITLDELIEDEPTSVAWHSKEETDRLLAMMADVHVEKVLAAKRAKEPPLIGTMYKRTRRNERGVKVQRAEVRFDGIAGCLRTPAGGSSRQVIFIVDENKIRSRLISSRETARLMGLPDSYKLPDNYNEAYHLTGDGVVVPVVRFLAKTVLEPILLAREAANGLAS